jgi:hypothetical protein
VVDFREIGAVTLNRDEERRLPRRKECAVEYEAKLARIEEGDWQVDGEVQSQALM